MTSPGLRTLRIGPENTELIRPPTPIAEVNRPSVVGLPPNRSALMAGTSATGSASTVAFRSARNAPASTWLRRMKVIPSAAARQPGQAEPGCGGMSTGSRATPYKAPPKLIASIR